MAADHSLDNWASQGLNVVRIEFRHQAVPVPQFALHRHFARANGGDRLFV